MLVVIGRTRCRLGTPFISSDYVNNTYTPSLVERLPSNPAKFGEKQSKWERFQDRYRFHSSIHDGQYDGSMWDYKPVPLARMLTRKHPRRLMPVDLIPFAGYKSGLYQHNLERVQWWIFFVFCFVFMIFPYEMGDRIAHISTHAEVGSSFHNTIDEADIVYGEELVGGPLHKAHMTHRVEITNSFWRRYVSGRRDTSDEQIAVATAPLGRTPTPQNWWSNTRFSAIAPNVF